MAGLLFLATVVVFVVVLKSPPQRQTTFPAARSSKNYNMMLKWPDVLSLAKNGNPAPSRKVVKTDAEWRAQLSPEQYQVTRQAGTERPFSSEMCSLFEPGIYACLCRDTVLFDASEKFESGTGWPSFTQPVAIDAIAYRFDVPAFLKRVETICNTCDAHLGHVFRDGPAPSGLRYCMNAVALKKVAKD
jgi:methionine-R-sulfoxide reductase